MLANLFSFSLLSLLLPIAVYAGSHGNPLLNRHHDLAKRADGNVELFKRFSGARWSFYNVETGNAGSCGTFHVNSDFTVAVNAAQMNSGLCYKTITMSYNGKTTTATISDTCPGCPYGGLDLTEGLFAFFAPQSVGIIYGTWTINGEAAPAPPVTTKAAPVYVPPVTTKKTTPVYVPPTTTWKPATTSTPKPTTTSTPKVVSSSSSKRPSSSSSPSSSAASSINYSSGAASGLAVPTGTVQSTPGSSENLADLYQAFIQVGGVIMAGANV